ncbi:hypothetical protein XENOCAPTIV_025602 [Xenoophorus captivus]|uniref:Uncharacterized protein n=1 Tax=Xenoophorus captivus TaxID=1517983 RepID=A0ABV0R672_9TELE
MRGRGPPKSVAFRDLPAEGQMVQPQPAEEGEPSKAAKRLKSVMKLSKLLAASKGGVQPSDAGPPGPSPWKKAKMLKMFGAGKKDKDYAKLMSARRIDSEESLTDRPAVTRPIESKSDARSRLSKVLKRITISNKLQVRRKSQSSVSHGSATGSEKDEEASQTASEDERKSKVSISVTESEPEGGASGSIKEKDSDEESSEKSSVDRDYLKGSSKKKTSGSDLSKRSSSGSQHSFRSKGSSADSRSTSGSRRSQTSVLSHGSGDTITEESNEEEEGEESGTADESKDSASEISSESSSRRSSVVSEGPGPSTPYHGQPYSPEIRSTSDETYGGLSPITEVDEDAISSDKSSVSQSKGSEGTEETSDGDSESEGSLTAF